MKNLFNNVKNFFNKLGKPETFRVVLYVGGGILILLVVISALFRGEGTTPLPTQEPREPYIPEGSVAIPGKALITENEKGVFEIEIMDPDLDTEEKVREALDVPDDVKIELIFQGAATGDLRYKTDDPDYFFRDDHGHDDDEENLLD